MTILETDIVAAFDTETTGVDPSIDRVRSIGIVLGTLKDGISSRISLLVDTKGVSSSPDALAVHKIPDNMTGGIPLEDAVAAMQALIGTRAKIAHNARFDIDMIIANLTRDGKESHIPAFLQTPCIDTMTMAKERFPGSRVNLDSLSKLCGITLHKAARQGRHDATEDAELAFMCWRQMNTKNDLFGSSNNKQNTDQTPNDDTPPPINSVELNW